MLFHKLLKKGYRPCKHKGINFLKKSTQIKSTDFLVRVIDAYSVGGGQIFKNNQIFVDPFIQPQKEEIKTVKEVEELYELAIKKTSCEVNT